MTTVKGQVPPYTTECPKPQMRAPPVACPPPMKNYDYCAPEKRPSCPPVAAGEVILRADRENQYGPLERWYKTGFPWAVVVYGITTAIFAGLAFVEILPGQDYIKPKDFAIAYTIAQFLLWLIVTALYIFYCRDAKRGQYGMSHRHASDLASYYITMTVGTILSAIYLWVYYTETKLNEPPAPGADALNLQFTTLFFFIFFVNLIMLFASLSVWNSLRHPEEKVLYLDEDEARSVIASVHRKRRPKENC